ncbi:MAG TPA: RnfABCDGE type electron transport complex subunit D [Acidimicrobiales bacterium]|nr:RnfABCDGE type electron transport complex subunit D [Acidimicrobiales bacterium]
MARTIRLAGRSYRLEPPSRHDPRLHVAAILATVQGLGQTSFRFELSIAQILVSLATCAAIDVAITMRRHATIAWPASALLTGNGIALLLRVNGTQPGDWWSLRGWWIYAGTAGVAMASKHVVRARSAHVFNPSNVGLLLCFAILGTGTVNPQDLWWGPPSVALAATQALVVIGGVAIARRLHFLRMAIAFWLTFATGIGVVTIAGHAITARWHVGTVHGATFWWVLVTSPEVLIFLFFMITDPQTTPRQAPARVVFGAMVGTLSAMFAAVATTEFGTKLALLAALAAASLARPIIARRARHIGRVRPPAAALAGGALVAVLAASGHFARASTTPSTASASPREVFVDVSSLPPISIDPSVGHAGAAVDDAAARRLVVDAIAQLAAEPGHRYEITRAIIVLVRNGQAPPRIGVRVIGTVQGSTTAAAVDRTIAPG